MDVAASGFFTRANTTWTSNPSLDPQCLSTREQFCHSFIKDCPAEPWNETGRALGWTLMELGGTGKQESDTEEDWEALQCIGMKWNRLGDNWEAQGRQLGTLTAPTRLCPGWSLWFCHPQVTGPYWCTPVRTGGVSWGPL